MSSRLIPGLWFTLIIKSQHDRSPLQAHLVCETASSSRLILYEIRLKGSVGDKRVYTLRRRNAKKRIPVERCARKPATMKRKENLLMTSKIHAPRLKLALLVSVLFTAAGLQAQGKWTSTNSLNFARSGQTANLLSTGMVLVAGGEN